MPPSDDPKPDIFTPIDPADLQKRIKAMSTVRTSEHYIPTPWEAFVEKWIWYDRGHSSHLDVDRMMEAIDRRGLVQRIWYFILYRIVHPIKDAPYNIRFWYRQKTQRAARGWANSDTWGFDHYLARVIVEGLRYLKKTKHGVPNACFPSPMADHTDEDMKLAEEKWDQILDDIIWTFSIAGSIQEHDWIYPPPGQDYFTDEELESWERFCENINSRPRLESDARVMTREEVARYRRGWKYFQDYFYSLWD